jgi:hypothetical protein
LIHFFLRAFTDVDQNASPADGDDGLGEDVGQRGDDLFAVVAPKDLLAAWRVETGLSADGGGDHLVDQGHVVQWLCRALVVTSQTPR